MAFSTVIWVSEIWTSPIFGHSKVESSICPKTGCWTSLDRFPNILKYIRRMFSFVPKGCMTQLNFSLGHLGWPKMHPDFGVFWLSCGLISEIHCNSFWQILFFHYSVFLFYQSFLCYSPLPTIFYPLSCFLSSLLAIYDGGLTSKSVLFLGLLTFSFIISFDQHMYTGFCPSMTSAGCMICSCVISVVD